MTSVSNKFSNRILSVSSSVIPEILGEPALVAVSIIGTEGVDSLFDYQVILKTPDSLNHLISETTNFDTAAWLGEEMSVKIQLEGNGKFAAGQMGMSGMGNVGAGVREINGIIDDAKFLREEGRYAFYEVKLKPWLFAATLVSDCKIYQNKTVKEVIDESLSGLNYAIEWRLIDTYPKRDYTTQFNESTFHFVSRLCETWGISYFFEHSDGKHRLIFTDYMGGYRPNPSEAYQTVLFHTPNAKIDEEYIHAFVPTNKLASGIFTTRDFDYTRPRADLTVTKEDPIQDASHNQHEVYEWHSPHSAHNHYVQPKAGPNRATNVPLDEGQFLARIRMEQLHCTGYRAHCSGHLKGLQPGHSFKLKEHPRIAANVAYLILNTKLTIREVAQETQNPGNPHAQRHEVHVDFEVYPLKGAGGYRPATKTPIPKMYGVESAIVVGPEKQDIWTDNLGRIKVQFHWDRLGKSDQNSSCWVRVSSPWAGNQLGGVHIPRMGQEVLISFISGNPDLPICTGRVHNQSNLPPWQLPSQQALSGFRSRELTLDGGNAAGGRSNHLVMDDSEGKIQAQLKSDHQHSQLSLGYVTRIEDNQGRKDERGEGFELRSDGHGSIRSGKGMLISTDARTRASGHIKDMQEPLRHLTNARDQHESLADLARQGEAQGSDADQRDVTKIIKAQNDAIKGTGGNPAAGDFPELVEPHLILASPAGIETTTAQSTHIASGEDTAVTTGRHFSIASVGTLFGSVGKGMRWFVHTLGIKMVAAAGIIEIKALTDMIRMIAREGIQLISTDKGILILAKTQVEIGVEGGARTVWKSSEINHYAEDHIVNAKNSVPGPKLMPESLPTLPTVDVCIPCLLRQGKSASPLIISE
ncbi:MAG: hypothetical protein NVS3B11_03150 [Collimonas sp.]